MFHFNLNFELVLSIVSTVLIHLYLCVCLLSAYTSHKCNHKEYIAPNGNGTKATNYAPILVYPVNLAQTFRCTFGALN